MSPEDLKSLRLKLNLTVDEAAKQVHISPRQWFRYEAGAKIPDRVFELFYLKNGMEFNKIKPTGDD